MEEAEARQNQLRMLGKGRRSGLSSLITHAQKSTVQQNLSLQQLGEEDHPLKEKLAHLGKPQQKLDKYVPWVEAARKSENQEERSVQYLSLRLSQLGIEKGRRPFQLEHIGLRFWEILSTSRFSCPQSERQPASKLLTLPDEILLYILWLVICMEQHKEQLIMQLETVCHQFRRLCTSSEVWRLMCSTVWGLSHSDTKGIVPYKNWKRMYAEWTTQVNLESIDTSDEQFVGDGNYIYEAEWRSSRYRMIRCMTRDVPITCQEALRKLRHTCLSRVFCFKRADDSSNVLTEHVGYCYLWSAEYMDLVEQNPLSEANIRSIVLQILSAFTHLSNSIWPLLGTDRCVMLFSCWPCNVFFSPDLKNIKLALWWYDLISQGVHNPDPRKYLFVAPEIILEDKPGRRGTNDSHIWCLGVILYAMLSLQFPFGGVDSPAVRVLMSILDDVPDYNGIAWDNVSDEAKNLVQRLLVKNPTNRITIQEILQHPWITGSLSQEPLSVYTAPQKTSVYRCFNPKHRSRTLQRSHSKSKSFDTLYL